MGEKQDRHAMASGLKDLAQEIHSKINLSILLLGRPLASREIGLSQQPIIVLAGGLGLRGRFWERLITGRNTWPRSEF